MAWMEIPAIVTTLFRFKVDINGESEWIKRIGVEDGILGAAYSAVELTDGNFVCLLIQRFVGISNYFPLFYAKLNPEGEVIDLHQLSENGTSNNGEFHILKRNDNELIVTTAPSMPYNVNNTHFKLYKLDNNGTILNSYTNEASYRGINPFDICDNGDILIALHKTSSDEPDNTHIYRFDGETLEPIPVPEQDDTNYDTLCPDGIAMSEYSFPTAEELGQSQLTITKGMAFQSFPNPVKDILSLQWTKPLEQTNETWLVECYDVFGKLIYNTEINSSSRSIALNTSAWKKGVYFLSIKHNNKLIYQNKIVK